MIHDLEIKEPSPATETLRVAIAMLAVSEGEHYESDSEMLFALMCTATQVYVDTCLASDAAEGQSLASMAFDATVLKDPRVLLDEHSSFLHHLDQTLQAVLENLEPSHV